MGLYRGFINPIGEKVEERIISRRSRDAITYPNKKDNPENMEKIRKLNERRAARKSIRNLLK